MVTNASETIETAARLRLAIVRMARRMRQEALGAEAGALSPTLAAFLGTIESCGPLTPSELAERERVKRPTATRAIAALEAGGTVARTADPADGRSWLVSATPAGSALLKRLRGRKNAYLAKRMSGLPDADRATLASAARILERMLDEQTS